MTNNDTNNDYTDLFLKLISKLEAPADTEPNIYKSESDGYLEKMRAQHQAARERLGITEEFSFKEPGE